MIRVEQIRLLESKVQKAVSLLSSLQEENSLLKTRLGEYEKRVDDLEYLLEEFKEEQQEIEQGIISALNKLETLETAAKQSQDSSLEEKKTHKAQTNKQSERVTAQSYPTNDPTAEALSVDIHEVQLEQVDPEVVPSNEISTNDSFSNSSDNISDDHDTLDHEEPFNNQSSIEIEEIITPQEQNKQQTPELDIF